MIKRKVDLSLYLVTRRDGLDDDAFFDLILKAVAGGVRIVQLREKGTPKAVFESIAGRLLKLLKPHNVPLIINDSIEIAQTIGADGVHLGQKDAPVSKVRKLLGRNAIIGLSIETLEQALEAQNLDVDYIAASPVFFTHSKSDIAKPWEIEGLTHLCKVSKHPVIGIGGINQNNLTEVLQSGAQGAAVVSSIFDAPDPTFAAQELRNIFLKHNK